MENRLINTEEDDDIRINDYVEEKVRHYIPNIPKKIIGYLVFFSAIMNISLICIMVISIIPLLPMYTIDRIFNKIYEECDEIDIKPEFAPFCCDHRDPVIGINCNNFIIGYGCSIIFFSTLYFSVFAKNNKNNNRIPKKLLFRRHILLFLSCFTFYLIYISIGSIIFFGYNLGCLKMQEKAELPENYRGPFTSIVFTYCIVATSHFTLAISILFSMIYFLLQ